MTLVGIFMLPFSSNLQRNVVSAEDPAIYYILEYKSLFGDALKSYKDKDECITAMNVADALGYTLIQKCVEAGQKGEKLTDEEEVARGLRTGVYFGCYGLDLGSWPNCIVKVVYVLIFQTLSGITTMAAGVLDFFINYSTNNIAYGSSFITKAWGAVRDIANIFFIIALLYVAIKTILGLSGHDGKKLLTYIIIIALVINFSLFVTKIVIDASNILAKVFYNQIEAVDGNGNPVDKNSKDRSITVGLVKQFDPVQVMDLKATTWSEGLPDASGNIGQFFFVLILSIALMCFMIYIFLSVALLFVARVISLWLAMILSPIAFVSKTVDFDLGALGWNKWMSELFKNAFMAPIFIFFLYIIILFGDFMSIGFSNNTDDLFIKSMNVFIPFMLVFVLLIKAKKLAVEYSGEMGAAIVKGGAVLGAMALGGAALGTAAIGRGTVGAFMKGASTGDTYARRLEAERTSGIRDEHLNPLQRIQGRLSQGLGINQMQQWMGDRLNRNKANIEHASHARHELNTVASDITHGAKKNWSELDGDERLRARTKLERDRIVKENQGTGATLISGGLGSRKWDSLTTAEKAIIDRMVGVDNHGAAVVGGALANNTTHADTTIVRDARRKVGTLENVWQSSVGGSYDIRNLSKIVAQEHDNLGNKLASGFTSVLAGTMRSSLKQTMGFNYGEGQKALFKDLGHTISEALKGAQIKIDLSSVGKVEAEKHGGGGGHH